jgi:predicted transcriptional regulator
MKPTEARREIRKTGIRQVVIARKIGVSQAFLSLWLHGKRPAPDGMLEEIVAVAKRLKEAIEVA